MIKVEFEFETLDQFFDFAIRAGGDKTPSKIKTDTKTTEVKQPKETKAEAATDTVKADMKPVETKTNAAVLDEDAIEKRRVTLRQLNSEKTTAGFKAEVKAIYAKYGATNVSNALPKDFDAIEADLKALGA